VALSLSMRRNAPLPWPSASIWHHPFSSAGVRAWSPLQVAHHSYEPSHLEAAYKRFRAAAQTHEIIDSWAALMGVMRLDPLLRARMLPTLADAMQPHLKFRQKQLLDKLSELRNKRHAEAGPSPVAPLRVLILGGGPMGLRCAVELALLGHTVVVLERRAVFDRLQVHAPYDHPPPRADHTSCG
jgi:hypothetical protein